MRAVDTNVLVRLTTRDDPEQLAAAEAFIAPGAWVPHIVLAEAMWVLVSVYGLERQDIARTIDVLLDHRDLTLQDAGIVAAALERYRGSSGIGFSDCLVLETARRAGHLPLGTFDRDLSRLPGAERL